MWLFVFVALVPLIEIALFIEVGSWIGVWPTLGLVLLTAVAGMALVRRQGVHAVRELRASVDALRDPSEPLAHGAMILVAGMLLLLPGFFTDACGLALLIPAVRRGIYRWLRARVKVQRVDYGARDYEPRPTRPEVIDGDYYEVGDARRGQTPRPPSGWTRH